MSVRLADDREPLVGAMRRDVDENKMMMVFTCAEFVGTFFVTVFAIGSVLSAGTLTFQFSYRELSAGRLLAIALANGTAYGAVVYTLRCISWSYCQSEVALERRTKSHYTLRFPIGHCNPAVTFAVCLVGDISVTLAIFHFVAQIAGAFLGALFIWCVIPNADDTEMGTTLKAGGASKYQALGMEVLTTFALVMVMLHFFVADTKKILGSTNSHLRTGPITFNHMAPFVVGLSVCALTLLGAMVSGASMNPVRSLASALLSDIWTDHWIYWAGPMIAALVAAVSASPLIKLVNRW